MLLIWKRLLIDKTVGSVAGESLLPWTKSVLFHSDILYKRIETMAFCFTGQFKICIYIGRNFLIGILYFF